MPRGKGEHMAGTTQESPKLARRAPRRAVRLSYPLLVAIRPRVAGPNAVSIHEEGGPAGRPTGGRAFLLAKLDLPASL